MLGHGRLQMCRDMGGCICVGRDIGGYSCVWIWENIGVRGHGRMQMCSDMVECRFVETLQETHV